MTTGKKTNYDIGDKIETANGFDAPFATDFDEATVFHLESLKQILCGFSVDFIKALVK